MFFYDDSGSYPVSGNRPPDVGRMDATAAYLRHYDNMLYLEFMAIRGTMIERAQAEKEIIICRRKLTFWERQPHFEKMRADLEVAKKNKSWGR